MRTMLSIVAALSVVANPAHGNIYQWEYINPSDPSQGRQQSTMLAPDGAGIDAVPGADLTYRNLTLAYLVNANLGSANLFGATLMGADLAGAQIQGASFYATDITVEQLYSTGSYQHRDLSGVLLGYTKLIGADFAGQTLKDSSFGGAILTGANFYQANLTNVEFAAPGYCIPYGGSNPCSGPIYASLSGANLTAVDARGATGLSVVDAITANLIQTDGNIDGLSLDAGAYLPVRDYDGNPSNDIGQISITVEEHLSIDPGGALRMVFEEDAWDSTISFAPGIPVALGGTLELTFAAGVNPATQLGRTLKVFNWTGVAPTGTIAVSSPHVWDLSNFYTTGEVTLIAVPDPSVLSLVALAFSVLIVTVRKRLSC